jgi:hypothetical protein
MQLGYGDSMAAAQIRADIGAVVGRVRQLPPAAATRALPDASPGSKVGGASPRRGSSRTRNRFQPASRRICASPTNVAKAERILRERAEAQPTLPRPAKPLPDHQHNSGKDVAVVKRSIVADAGQTELCFLPGKGAVRLRILSGLERLPKQLLLQRLAVSVTNRGACAAATWTRVYLDNQGVQPDSVLQLSPSDIERLRPERGAGLKAQRLGAAGGAQRWKWQTAI